MIYVDDLVDHGRRGKIRSHLGTQWCHMWADDGEEDLLHIMAQHIGLKRAWFQPRRFMAHYDLTPFMREKALALGATPMSALEYIRRARRKAEGSE